MNDAQSVAETRLTVLRGAALVASPWKNGGGITREIAAEPAPAGGALLDAFAWRVSVADVAQAGPFSRFPGVDRTLVLLEGAGMLLDETGPRTFTHSLTQPLDIARFAGEAAIDARLVNGATRDFNLMVRRDAARGTLEVWRDDARRSVQAQTVLLYCAQGERRISVNDETDVTLAPGDTLRIDVPRRHRGHGRVQLETQGAGALLTIALSLHSMDPQ
jgi:environmental stress-induced protein Ves